MITIILFAIYNGLFISWQQNIKNKAAKWSKYWHFLGIIIRASVLAEIVFLHDFYITLGFKGILLAVFVCWFCFNLIINITRKLCGANIKVFHLSSLGFDGHLNKIISKLLGFVGRLNEVVSKRIIWILGFLPLIAVFIKKKRRKNK